MKAAIDRAVFGAACCCVALLFWPGEVRAQQPQKQQDAEEAPCETTPLKTALAKERFEAGTAAFEAKRYEIAAYEYQKAYDLDCSAHRLLINVAHSYAGQGQIELAIQTMKRYLEAQPADQLETGEADKRRARIKEWEDELEAKEAVRAAETQLKADEAQVVPPAPLPPPQVVVERVKKPVWPLFLSGGGLALSAISGGLYVKARNDISDADSRCGGRVCDNPMALATANNARKNAQLAGGFAIAGTAIAAGGLVLYLTDPFSPKADPSRPGQGSVRVSPELSPRYAGFQATGRF